MQYTRASSCFIELYFIYGFSNNYFNLYLSFNLHWNLLETPSSHAFGDDAVGDVGDEHDDDHVVERDYDEEGDDNEAR